MGSTEVPTGPFIVIKSRRQMRRLTERSCAKGIMLVITNQKCDDKSYLFGTVHRQEDVDSYYVAIRRKTWLKTLKKGVASYEMLRRGACGL